jgi:hypothetical protein
MVTDGMEITDHGQASKTGLSASDTARYQKANRAGRAKILDEFCVVCGYHRHRPALGRSFVRARESSFITALSSGKAPRCRDTGADDDAKGYDEKRAAGQRASDCHYREI